MPKLARYRKGITGYAGLILTWASTYYGGNHWVALAVAIAAGAGVVAVPNAPEPGPPPVPPAG